jgi:hypothetical protein
MKTHLIFWWGEGYFDSYCGRRFTRLDRGLTESSSGATCIRCLREHRAVEFSNADHKAALAQGWLLGDYSIERDDEAARFVDDNAAAAYVVGRAEGGCKLAQKALRYYGKREGQEINGTLILRPSDRMYRSL